MTTTRALKRAPGRRRSWRPAVLGLCASLALAPAVAAQSLDACMKSLRATRAARRITAGTWSKHATGLVADQRVLAALNAQPEVILPVWDYVAATVDQERIDDGRRLLREHHRLLTTLARRYDVDAEVVVAIWGLESNFGRGRGGFSVVRSLATLSCAGRRQSYFRGEFLAALRILQGGHLLPEHFVGSWAGAFGHTQFMPGTFEWLAVDYDGDGRRDIIDNIPDALASTARFLQQAGWRANTPWGVEVRLPDGLPLVGENRRTKRPLSAWVDRGVTRIDGSALPLSPPSAAAGLVLPAGPTGPAFLTFRNFDALIRYNASERYALAVAHLSDRLRGGPPFTAPWPTSDLGLSRAERRELQTLLAKRGHDIGAIDAILTQRTRDAVRAEQRRLSMEPNGRPGQQLLQRLRTADQDTTDRAS